MWIIFIYMFFVWGTGSHSIGSWPWTNYKADLETTQSTISSHKSTRIIDSESSYIHMKYLFMLEMLKNAAGILPDSWDMDSASPHILIAYRILKHCGIQITLHF